jgi:enterobactin synthetase component D
VSAGAPRAFTRATPFGRLVGVALPDEDDAAAVDALAATLPRQEQAYAHGLPPARRVTWVGGRVALRAALADLGLAPGAILATPRGAPALPAGVAGTIAHKRTLAVALAAAVLPEAAVTLGVDVEVDRATRVDISEHVLTARERRRVDALDAPARARAVLTLFAAKEALYKALDPWLGRFVSFQEVELERAADGALAAAFTPRAGEPSFVCEVHEEPLDGHLDGHILLAARVVRRSG